MRAFFRFYDRILGIAAYLAAAVIGAAALATVADAAMRNFGFGYGIAGIVELTEYGLAIVTLIGAAWVLRARGHISIDIVLDSLPARARRVAEFGVGTAMLGVSAALVVAGGLATLRSIKTGHMISKTYTFPEWWLQCLLPISGILLGIECVRQLCGHAEAPKHGAHAEKRN